jgi:hypothetical protein
VMARHLFFFFQISAKNKDIWPYGEAVFLNVETQEKGENNTRLMCYIHTHTHTHTHTNTHTCFLDSAPKCQLIS